VTSSTHEVQVSSLVVDREYPINRAERVGDMVLITFRDSPEYVSQVFLPYAFTYSDKDLNDINSRSTCYTIMYRGYIRDSTFHMVDIIKDHPRVMTMKCNLRFFLKIKGRVCVFLFRTYQSCS
jgi:hypothetical protein